ncbi:MAG TPA: sulfur carrier protein ThiS [Stellaceae bacterium]|nr:sulfur carrier protein ThiS [Stellaceae bacterium]
MTDTIRVNGKDENFAGGSIASLVAARGMAGKRGVAIAVNGAVVPARRWPETQLAPGDEVEIVRPFGGG